MITCPSCSHQNPDGAIHCEACYTPLPVISMIDCPNCGASVQSDAKFCGHCGYNLHSAQSEGVAMTEQSPDAIANNGDPNEAPEPAGTPVIPAPAAAEPQIAVEPLPETAVTGDPEVVAVPPEEQTEINIPETAEAKPAISSKTQLQQIKASLLHVQTNVTLEIPPQLTVVHIGKPNNMIPPDIDVSGFPDSDIVSRVHGDLRFEGDAHYFEDTGSSNGTYINNTALPAGNRHRLRPGDRISLGKGDKVTFIFQLSE
jgi:pSer/pThr/pTyr-binding forkhead associated (FHA) protein